MNKLSVVLGVAVVATLAGCKDPNYKQTRLGGRSASEVRPVPVKTVETEPVLTPDVKPVVDADDDIQVVDAPEGAAKTPAKSGKGETHLFTKKSGQEAAGKPGAAEPVAGKPGAEEPVAGKPGAAEPAVAAETTTYIVQRGDTLSKISKKYNVKLDAIQKANPGLKADKIRLGQKIVIPAKVDVGVQTVPAGAIAPAPKKVYVPYVGATKDYKIAAGDTLGKIAYSNGINIRQLKEMNGLKSDAIRAGQTIKIPAEKVVSAAAPKSAVAKAEPVAKPVEKPAAKPVVDEAAAPAAADEGQGVSPLDELSAALNGGAETASDAAKAADPVADTTLDYDGPTYVVRDGEDLTGVALKWGVSPSAIRELNNLAEEDVIRAGQVLRLPANAIQ